MASLGLRTPILVALVAGLLAYLYGPFVHRFATVTGIFRTPQRTHTAAAAAADVIRIDDTVYCEDVHFHAPSRQLFTACQDEPDSRFLWWPPLGNLAAPGLHSRGSLHVIDAATRTSRRLTADGFEGPFFTHGIDVIDDPARPRGEAVYVFAVNHLAGKDGAPRSRVEVFHHVIGTTRARHVRSVWHALMTTPNDVFAVGPREFYVTNDHYYGEGRMRLLEDLRAGADGGWTDTIRVRLLDMEPAAGDDGAGVEATVALRGLHNNNGLGHGRTDDEVLVVSAASGILHLGKLVDGNIQIRDKVFFDSTVDNPSYFDDPYATATDDRSAFVSAGLSRVVDFLRTRTDPTAVQGSMVWLARPTGKNQNGTGEGAEGKWDTRLLFEDDGTRLRTASAAVLVAIDPKTEGGQRKAWLFATGFLSRNMLAVKVDL